jgi:transposase
LEDLVPEGHPARLISNIVDMLDLSCIEETYSVEGRPAYHPRMLFKVLLHAYSNGVVSSREIEDRITSDTAYMYLAGMQKPDYRTICRFRTERLGDLQQVFDQVVRLCMETGLTSLGLICIDGTKLKANASKKQTKDIEGVQAEIDRILRESIRTDLIEDREYGDSSPYRLPPGLDTKEKRLGKLKLAIEKLGELELRPKGKWSRKEKDDKKKKGGKKGGSFGQAELEGVLVGESKGSRVNITDPDSRLMHGVDGFRQGFNGQIAVEAKSQVIVGARLCDCEADTNQLLPLLDETVRVAGVKPLVAAADSGYYSLDNLVGLDGRGVTGLVPCENPGVKKDYKYYPKTSFYYDPVFDVYRCPGGNMLCYDYSYNYKGVRYGKYSCDDCPTCRLKEECTRSEKRTVTRDPRDFYAEEMRARLTSKEGKALFKKRKTVVEPVFGNLKHNKKFREFKLRGQVKAGVEFLLACITHNIDKIMKTSIVKTKNQKQQDALNMKGSPSF